MRKVLRKILRFLHHFFIPHKHNEYRPHIFREASIASILLVSLITFAISITSALIITSPSGASIVTRVLVDLTNDHRISNGLNPLFHNETLDNAALLKAKDMAMWGYFAHYSPTGVTPWSFFDKVGYVFLFAGENLAINFTDSRDIQEAWMASPTHRKNILDPRFKEIGLATQEGVYDGYPTIYVVQFFGSPALRSTTVVATTSTSTSQTTGKKNKAITSVTKATSRPSNEFAANTRVKGAETTLSANDVIPDDERIAGGLVSATQTEVTIPEYSEQAFITILAGDTSFAYNTDPELLATNTTSMQMVVYSTWYERSMMAFPRNIQIVYTIVLIILLLASLSFICIEIRREHHKHIIYTVLIVIILLILMYLNKAYIISQVPFIKF